MRIANNEVTNITRETAQVGCTKVTRQEVEVLLQEMNKIPETKDFEVLDSRTIHSTGFVCINVNHGDHGWIGVSEDAQATMPDGPQAYKWRSAFLCLRTTYAEKLLRALAQQLNLTVSSSQKYIIEYQYTDPRSDWMRSGNKRASGEFDSFEMAQREVSKQQEFMGNRYEYRAKAI